MSGDAVRLVGDVAYDPARRTIVFTPEPGQMIPGVEYVFTATTGVTTWQGAPLGAPLARAFVPGEDPYVPPPAPTRPALRRDVAPLLASHCALAGCHTGGPDAVMALDLSSADAILNTTVRVASRELDADDPQSAGEHTDPRWGAMYRVDPGDSPGRGAPAYSYLFYKLVGEGPIVGVRMPPASAGPPLDAESIARVADWIARGAPDD